MRKTWSCALALTLAASGWTPELRLIAQQSENARQDAAPKTAAPKGDPKSAPKEAPKNAPAQPAPQRAETPKPARRTNRLAKETSPYLLQHAHNPVDWRPWNEESLAAAQREKKPIFLSIGYSSCHWCHVMERESFVDDEIAAILNKHFICIKVDREERPDIDHVYMTSLHVFQQLTRGGRGGGWPLSMFLTPAGEPFFGGTYFPARDGDRGASTGFLTLVTRIAEVWEKDPEKIEKDAKTITRFVKLELEEQRPALATPLDRKLVEGVFTALRDQFDPEWGGFSFSEANPNRPKFPEPPNLNFLLDRAQRLKAARQLQGSDEERLLDFTLRKMAQGGIRDHWGGGFHRYSVDRFWRIPHFEKMLYDNAQLASVYAQAHVLLGREEYRRVAVETLEFMLREMAHPEGGFYSALDADSEDEEGKFYRWERAEVEKTLGAADAALVASIYGFEGEPNFEDEYFVPQLARPLAEFAAEKKLTEAALEARLAPLRAKLLAERNRRARPLTDTKLLTSWNGLAIRGFADCGRLLGEPKYTAAAKRAAEFFLARVRTNEGRLLRTFSQDQAKLNAYLTDYASFVDGLIALHQATGEQRWLETADELTRRQLELFGDDKQGGFFFTSGDHESLLGRSKEFVDGVEPSGNSLAAANLVYLGKQLQRREYLEQAERTIRAGGALLESAPSATPRLGLALADWLDAPRKP